MSTTADGYFDDDLTSGFYDLRYKDMKKTEDAIDACARRRGLVRPESERKKWNRLPAGKRKAA